MADPTTREYRCELCGDLFTSEWSEEEAKAEMRALFGDVPLEERAEVCDTCFKKLRRREAAATRQPPAEE